MLFSAAAHAHGTTAGNAQLLADPGHPERLVVMTVFGLVTSGDAGTTWDWICPEVIGYYDANPAFRVAPSGHILVAHFEGMSVSPADGCGWTSAAGLEQQSIHDLTVFEDRVAAISCDVRARSCRYHESSDGVSFAQVGVNLPDGFVATTLDVGPGRIYAAGLHDVAMMWQGELARSDDGGDTWTLAPLPADGFNVPYLVGFVPPDRLYLRVASTPAKLIFSDDGGATWNEIFAQSGALTSVALSPDGTRIVLSDRLDGTWRAETTSHAFERIGDRGAECLHWAPEGVLYGCFEQDIDGFFIGVSADEGASFTALFERPCLRGPLGCVTDTCASGWDLLSLQLETSKCGEATSSSSSGAGGSPQEPPHESSGCGCELAPRSSAPSWTLLLALTARRKQRRRSLPPSASCSTRRRRPASTACRCAWSRNSLQG